MTNSVKFHRLLAIDPSLTCSGWALFDLQQEVVLGVGKVKSQPPTVPLQDRLVDLQSKIEGLISSLGISPKDLVLCEAPTTMKDPRAAIKVEQVRGIFESIARARSATVPGRLNPRSVHSEVLGLTGKQVPRKEVKEVAVQICGSLFSRDLKKLGFDCSLINLKRHQDIVDALLIGHLAVRKIKGVLNTGGDLSEVFTSRDSWNRRGRELRWRVA